MEDIQAVGPPVQIAANTLFDWALSGDIRHALMNDIMSGIFNNKGW
jgi:hypothetical protein